MFVGGSFTLLSLIDSHRVCGKVIDPQALLTLCTCSKVAPAPWELSSGEPRACHGMYQIANLGGGVNAKMVKRSGRGFTIVCYTGDPKLFKNNMKKKYRNSIRIFQVYIISQIKGKNQSAISGFLIVASFLTNKTCYLLSTYYRSETVLDTVSVLTFDPHGSEYGYYSPTLEQARTAPGTVVCPKWLFNEQMNEYDILNQT